MMKLFQVVAFLGCVLLASGAAARAAPEIVSAARVNTGISGADLSTSPQSLPIRVDQYSLLKITINLTRNLAADVSFFCEESDDGTTNFAEITKVESDTVSLFNPTRGVTASVVYTIRIDITGFIFVRCTFAGTNSTSSDLITVTGRLVRGI